MNIDLTDQIYKDVKEYIKKIANILQELLKKV